MRHDDGFASSGAIFKQKKSVRRAFMCSFMDQARQQRLFFSKR